MKHTAGAGNAYREGLSSGAEGPSPTTTGMKVGHHLEGAWKVTPGSRWRHNPGQHSDGALYVPEVGPQVSGAQTPDPQTLGEKPMRVAPSHSVWGDRLGSDG